MGLPGDSFAHCTGHTVPETNDLVSIYLGANITLYLREDVRDLKGVARRATTQETQRRLASLIKSVCVVRVF